MPSKKLIPIELDKERNLLVDLNAMCAFEEKTGRKFLDVADDMYKGNWPSMIDFRALFWALLIHEDPKLTLKKVGEILEMTPETMQKMADAIQANMPTSKDDGEAPLAEKPRQE